MKKLFKKYNNSILWLAYKQGQVFERHKFIDKFINMMNQFDNPNVINTINEVTVIMKI